MIVESLKARFAIIGLVFFTALLYTAPNLRFFKEIPWWPAKNKLIYGLDIQGGLHLVLSANVGEAVHDRLTRQGHRLKTAFAKQGVEVEKTHLGGGQKSSLLILELKDPADTEKAADLLKSSDFSGDLQLLRTSPGRLETAYHEIRLAEFKKQILQQSIEVIRGRIDEFGVSEPLINSQGEDRIVVQLPGIEDSQKAKDLIRRTARLDLAIVNEAFGPEKLSPLIEEAEKAGAYSLESLSYREYIKKLNSDLKNNLPENGRIVFEKPPGALTLKAGRIPYLVDMGRSIQGGLLEDASVVFDQNAGNKPLVSFRFQPEGRKRFSDLTARAAAAEPKERLAVILDSVLKSAPVVQSRIWDEGQISLGSGNYEELLEEAEMTATTLRTGALPASLDLLEERAIGPTLGKTAIEKGKTAGLAGLFLVIVFMLLCYRRLGAVADLCLAGNIFLLLALMSSLSAVLTLPGVAGIILTVGMAVDANVIIFERIKEEIKKGAGFKLAVRDGFSHAFSAILDANITTAIVCFVLIYFSTGPVRGFAVTLLCGIVTSLFTAVFLSRTLMDFLILKANWKRI